MKWEETKVPGENLRRQASLEPCTCETNDCNFFYLDLEEIAMGPMVKPCLFVRLLRLYGTVTVMVISATQGWYEIMVKN